MNLNIQTHMAYLRQHVSKEVADGAEALMVKAHGSLAQLRRKIAESQTDERLTTKGKQEQLLRLVGEAKIALADVSKEVTGYAANLKTLESKLTPKPVHLSAEDRFERLLRQREIRDLLRQSDPLEVAVLYQEAVNNGWDETALAIESAPQGFSLIDAETKAAGLQRRAERDNPDVAKKMMELRTTHDSVQYVISALQREVEETAGCSTADPIVVGAEE